MKRHKFLQPLSKEHHQGLLLCWKIRIGFTKGIEHQRIKNYVDWFFENHISSHIKVEEKYLFPLLGPENQLVKKAKADHRRLNRLLKAENNLERSLSQIEDELERHIRFEEQVLFQKIQEIATDDQLELVNILHRETEFVENTEDEFWK